MNESITFPTRNIHHLFIKFDPKFIILLCETLYELPQPPTPPIKRRCFRLLLQYFIFWKLQG